MSDPRCVIHPTRQAPPPLPESRACKQCVTGLEQDLTDIDRLIPTLRGMLSAAAVVDELHRSSGYGSRAPINLGVSALLDPRSTDGPDIVLARWAHHASVAPTGQALRGRLGWIVEQPFVTAFARDIRALAGELRRVCGAAHSDKDDPPPAPRRVARCRRPIRDNHECGGWIVVTPGEDVAVCERCREGWTKDRWLFLARLADSA